MVRSSVVIVSPVPAGSNNGNAQTARRWARLLGDTHRVRVTQQWPDAGAAGDAVMLALHARRSAAAVQAWAGARGPRGLAVVLTGTDLYQDIATDAQARRSLELAARLVVLQDQAVDALPAAVRAKARVIYQSTPARATLPKTARRLHAVMVGHLREVKSPQTLFEAVRLLAGRADIRITHIGEAGEPHWADLARAAEAANPAYRWLGGLPHARVRSAIQRAHLLVHTSALEGGAHVIMEAVRSGTPVLASGVSGNIGMLGTGYEGYFTHGDAAQLAALLARCRAEQVGPPDDPPRALLPRLRTQCGARAPLFAPEAERDGLLRLIHHLQDTIP
ncbi:selenoneine biosynthesis selenosugar synthase SenB [Ramlibacter tataouinensis]|uniref:A-glycosyltransferase, Glycosyltransferase Family 4-like protein n=1 Tax=Ramlibacter tataouinensis (strain ATCC BAA-407 / DSM 14655 / LMG 21543 / TTB310) TaxID=365046 RepID=F5XZB5_RAMTT|nr:selenoneine biosynthesis selenosugar synthase SenB [Ramlibacter tataouinensis]AEG94472.1 a-glycosyltransferase, Glycosyltransferase Family 4-like protein [Ramlibacter tataouinensis TTB310]